MLASRSAATIRTSPTRVFIFFLIVTRPSKANQDAWVCTRILDDPNALLLGVFDGHGGEGDLCATFAARKLPAVF